MCSEGHTHTHTCTHIMCHLTIFQVFVDDLDSLANKVVSQSVESICVGDGGLEQLCIASKAGADILNLSEAGQKTENEASQVPGSDSHPEQNLSGLEQPQHPTTSGSNKATTKHHQFNKYTSVGDLKADWSAASPTAQKLFQTKTDPSNRALHSINQLPDSVLQITAKV